MADYAGAVAAMRDRFVANFTAAPIGFQNENPPQDTWPPSPPSPWVYFEVIQTSSEIRGAGKPGSQTWLTLGNIFIHVFAPRGFALPDHLALVGAAGEVFRAQTFYTADPGAKVICMAPSVQGGGAASDNGDWFGFTVSIPFEFYFLA